MFANIDYLGDSVERTTLRHFRDEVVLQTEIEVVGCYSALDR